MRNDTPTQPHNPHTSVYLPDWCLGQGAPDPRRRIRSFTSSKWCGKCCAHTTYTHTPPDGVDLRAVPSTWRHFGFCKHVARCGTWATHTPDDVTDAQVQPAPPTTPITE